jgi:WD40 repeat protein
VTSGKEIRSFPSLVQVTSLALAADGKTLAGACGTSFLWWLNTETGEVLHKVTRSNSQRLPISFLANGKTVAAGTSSGVHFFDVATGQETRRLAPKLRIDDLAISADEKVLAAIVGSNIRRWDLTSGRELPVLPARKFTAWVAFVPGGKWLVSSDQFSVIQFWDLVTGKDNYQIRSAGRLIHSRMFDISRDGKMLAYSFGTGIGFWDVSKKQNVEMPGHQGRISALAFAPDGQTLASGSWDNTVRIWQRNSGKELKRWQLPLGEFAGITGLAYSPDGKRLAAIGDDGTIRLWDNVAAKELASLTTRPHFSPWPDRSLEVAYSPDGKFLIALGKRSIRIGETTGGKELPTIKAEAIQKGNTFEKLAISPDSKSLAVGFSNGSKKILIHDLVDGKPRVLDIAPNGGLYQLAFSPDGRMLAVGGIFYPNFPNTGSFMLELRESATGAVRGRIRGKNMVSALAFAADGRTLILALRSGDPRHPVKDVLLWDLEEIGRFKGHIHTVSKLAISPDGRWLATGSEDSTVLIWDLGNLLPRKPVRKLSGRDLNDLFTDLAGDDSQRAYWATRILAAAGDKTVDFLRRDILERLVKGTEGKRIASLVAQMEKREFAVRQQAQQKLAELGEFAEPALQQALQEKPSLEFRRRAEKLIAQMGSTRMRLSRAVEVLEMIGTPKARRVLAVVAQGPPTATLTREATDALRRLKKTNVRESKEP